MNFQYIQPSGILSRYIKYYWILESDINDELYSSVMATGNISLDLINSTGNYYFTDWDGTDNDVLSMTDNDWTLTSSTPLNVRGGALNLSSYFTVDFNGTTRTTSTPTGMTNNGAAGWSCPRAGDHRARRIGPESGAYIPVWNPERQALPGGRQTFGDSRELRHKMIIIRSLCLILSSKAAFVK